MTAGEVKFSEAISWIVVFCRVSSRARMSASSGSTAETAANASVAMPPILNGRLLAGGGRRGREGGRRGRGRRLRGGCRRGGRFARRRGRRRLPGRLLRGRRGGGDLGRLGRG